MGPKTLLEHVDFTNPVSWVALAGFAVALVNTAISICARIRDGGRLRLDVSVQGPHRSDLDEVAMKGDGVYLTMVNEGTKPVAVSHIGGKRITRGFRASFKLYQQPRDEWTLPPGAMRTKWVLDAQLLNPSLLWLGVTDTLGRTWRVPRRKLRKLIGKEARARRNAIDEFCESAPEEVVH